MNNPVVQTIICGRGRLGQLIVSSLREQQIPCEHGRIDAVRGLTQGDRIVAGNVETLILCFVPKHTENASGWHGLLQGLLQQVQNGVLQIKRVLFVSSTAVYDEYENGVVDAQTKASGSSVRAKGLLDAENTIPPLATSSRIFRLTGLVGPGYNKYDPLTYSMEKPRQAVDTRAVAAEVAKWHSQQPHGHTVEVLTDGWVYWRGEKLDLEQDGKQLAILGKQHRLLKPSIVCRVV